MNKEEFYNYIIENFNISVDAARLIDNILNFVNDNFKDKGDQQNALHCLLDGTIGLNDEEIENVCM